MKVHEKVQGLTECSGSYYIACGNKIIKIDKSGKNLKEYKTGVANAYNVIATKEGCIVYSNCFGNTVNAITDWGDTVWQYTHPNMKEPRGLEIDSAGNIFVAAKLSNNIHVLSGAGVLIRIIDDIPRPSFIKLMAERSLCCVCSDEEVLKVYKLYK
jgi:DNA-binding beta-propeller fold protein YncE